VHALVAPMNEFPMLKAYVADTVCVPRRVSTPQAQRSIFNKLQLIEPNIREDDRLVVLNTHGGIVPIRAWPLKNYVQLAQAIIERHQDVCLVLIGAKEAQGEASHIRKHIPQRCVDFTGKTTLKELVDLFDISDAIIGNDSGPAHFASLTSIANIVIFGPETPELYKPLGAKGIPLYSRFSCSPCVSAYNHRNTPCAESKCLSAITVDMVYEVVRTVLESKSTHKRTF
jgi:ADP-heptose:LPS heptosyltransferase